MKYLEKALKESERLNVVDESGDLVTTVSGDILTVARGPARTFGIPHQTSNILAIMTRGSDIKVVLQKRSKKKDIFPGAWTVSCGGHMGTAINPRKAVIREAQEELNITIQRDRLIPLGNPDKGCRNLLKVWKFRGDTLIQMGQNTNFVSEAPQVPSEINNYILDLPLEDLPGATAPDSLFLETFNQEFCFYYLYVLSEDELSNIIFTDGEVEGFKEVELDNFINADKADMTDSSLTLLENVPNLADIIIEACK